MTSDAQNTPGDIDPVFEQIHALQQSKSEQTEISGESSKAMEENVIPVEKNISERLEKNVGEDQIVTKDKNNRSLYVLTMEKGKHFFQKILLDIQGVGKKEGSFFHFLHKSKDKSAENILIENILSQGKEEEEKTKQKEILYKKNAFAEDRKLSPEEMAQQKTERGKAEELLRFSKVLTLGILVIPLFSFLFSAMFLSTSGFFSTLVEDKNYALNFRKKTEELHTLKLFVSSQEKKIADLEGKIAEIKENKVLAEIADNRIHWREVFETINRITDTAFEGNKISKYVNYSNYSGNSKNETIQVDGNVRSLVGASWQDLIKLRNVLSSHDSFEPEEIYFRQFVKHKAQNSSQIATSEYVTPFSLSFKYIREDLEEGGENDLHAAP